MSSRGLRITLVLVGALGGASCGDDDAPAHAPATQPAISSIDAGAKTAPIAVADAGDTLAYHIDDPTVSYTPRSNRKQGEKQRMIELTLRSTPPGATAAVGGVAVGSTPAFWTGPADGRPREFTFVLPGYAMARYRFVPTNSGIVHGTLKRLTADVPDAGPPE
jgi:hypothetical protein